MPEPFAVLASCNLSRAVEIRLTSLATGAVETIRLDAPLVVIGRGSQCDLRLTHPDVSRRHACIHLFRDRALCVDLGSRTGVYWNEERRQHGWLDADRPVRIGPFELQLAVPMPAPNGDAGAEAGQVDAEVLFHRHSVDETELDGTGLHFLNHGKSLPPVSLVRPITLIGRAETCKLRLRDESVSRVHSSLMVTPDGVWIADLLGRGGVRVNGEFVSLSRLSAGDEIQIGRYRLAFATDLVTASDRAWETEPPAPGQAVNGRSPVATGGVSESLLLAMTETFADMQRQMNEQFRYQMELMVGLIESMRNEMSGEIRRELARLVSIGEEIRDTQRRLAVPSLPASEAPGQGRSEPVSTALDPPPSTVSGATGPRETSSKEFDPRGGDGVADHVFMARRLRDLERERNSRWERLVGLLKGDS